VTKPSLFIVFHIAYRDTEDPEEVIKAGLIWPCEIKESILPCGSTSGPWTFKTFPRENVPCPCGDPTHWLVKYERLSS